MPTETELQTKINELESWLKFNHAEHLAVAEIQADLRKAKQELAELQTPRTYEQDTFNIQDHDFNN